MQIKHLALAAGLLLMSAGAASAAPALVTGDLNLRSGPGTNFGVISVLPGGATVNVLGCGGGWCRIAWRGAGGYGYASSNYLDLGGPRYAAAPPVYVAPPPVFSFGFGFGPGWRHDRGWDGDRHGYRHHDSDYRRRR
jgi:uncharacterized protein YraI